MSTPKVRWRLFSDESEPTSRERGGNVYRELVRQGWDAGQWDGVERADIIVLQYSMRDLEAALDAAPVVVADINDLTFVDSAPGPWRENRAGLSQVHAVVAGSPRLEQHLQRLHHTVRMIEQPTGPQYWTVKPKKHAGLHLCWMGMHDNIIYFRDLDPVLAELAGRHEFTVHFCTSARSGLDHADGFGRDNVARVAAKPYPTEFHEWDVDGVLKVMASCDIGIAPLWDNEWCRCKCANKAVNMMAAGLPVAVSDIPAYRAVIEDGVNGRICGAPEEWARVLDDLLSDATNRRRMAKAGKASAAAFQVETIAGQWAEFFEEVG